MTQQPGLSSLRALVDVIARALESQPARVAARLWPEVAGEQLAARTWVSSVRGDTMYIVAASSVWAHQLQLMERDLVARLRSRAGEGCPVERLRFRAGGRPMLEEDGGIVPSTDGFKRGRIEARPRAPAPEVEAAAREAARKAGDAELAGALERALRAQDPPGAGGQVEGR